MTVIVTASWADSGAWRHVYATVTITDGTSPVEDATVSWSIDSVSQGALANVGSGIYEATSSGTYHKNHPPDVTATAAKSGCLSGSEGPVMP